MNFKYVKQLAIDCLLEGNYTHAIRKQINVKNLFQCGQIDADHVVKLLKLTRGDQYECRPHHKAANIDVHIFKPVFLNIVWYIKFCFLDKNMLFISVHMSEVQHENR